MSKKICLCVGFFLEIVMLSCLMGICSVSLAESRELCVNPFTKIARIIVKGSVSYQCKQMRFCVAEPAMSIYNSFVKDYNNEYKKNGNKHSIAAKLMQQRAHDDVVKLKALGMQLDDVDIVKSNDEFFYYLRKYVEYATERIACVEKQALEKDDKIAMKFCDRGFALQKKEMYEAKYGYENAESILFSYGVGTYNIRPETVRYVRKGSNYMQLMHLFRMPGYFLEPIVVVDTEKTMAYPFQSLSAEGMVFNTNQMIGIIPQDGKLSVEIKSETKKKQRVHQPVVWHDKDKLVYVDFVNGKAENWKFIRVNSGFLNIK